jgi:hypothetical protein
MRFAEVGILGLLGLACSATAASGGAPGESRDTDSGSGSAFHLVEAVPTGAVDCTRGTRLEGEFRVECPDASPPPKACSTHLDPFGKEVCADAGEPSPPPPPPPADPDEGPCAVLDQKTCQDAFFETEPRVATCSISGDTVRLSVRQCEVCNLAGTRNQYAMVVKACGGCEQVYSSGYSDDQWYSALECDAFSMTESLDNTYSEKTCVDIYVSVGTSGTDNVTDGIHSIRTCRCDRTTDTCVICVDGACGTTP